jgi:hypothetical protein
MLPSVGASIQMTNSHLTARDWTTIPTTMQTLELTVMTDGMGQRIIITAQAISDIHKLSSNLVWIFSSQPGQILLILSHLHTTCYSVPRQVEQAKTQPYPWDSQALLSHKHFNPRRTFRLSLSLRSRSLRPTQFDELKLHSGRQQSFTLVIPTASRQIRQLTPRKSQLND